MASMDFPANPVDGETYLNYRYDAAKGAWRLVNKWADTMPAGAVIPWAASVAPPNWLLCDGSAISRTEYAALFSVIGVLYGSGNGSTTFNVPDLRGRTIVGVDSIDSDFSSINKSGGAKKHTLTIDEMPSHTHTQDAHAHTYYYGSGTYNAGSGYSLMRPAGFNIGSGTSSTTATNQNTGGGQSHNNLQPYRAMNYIIKATFGTTPDQSQSYDILATYNSRLTTLEQEGRVLQVINASSGTAYSQSITGGTFFNFPNNQLQIQVTPSTTNSKFILMGSVTVGTNGNDAGWRFIRNGSPVGVGNVNGARQRGSAVTGWLQGSDTNHTFTTISNNYVDAPLTTSQVTYNIQAFGEGSITYLNRTGSYADSSVMYNTTMFSSLTVMEIAG